MSAEYDYSFFAKCAFVVLDVAGTVSSTEFVQKSLFAYAEEHAEEYLKEHFEDAEVQEAIKKLECDKCNSAIETAAVIKSLTNEKSQNDGLKTIQGMIYKKGYDNGSLKAHIYDDVPLAMETWSKTAKIVIYSTGSIESQKLLFTHTTAGDLSNYISKYFDQTTGSKIESNSYIKIVEELKSKPDEVVFLTDNIDELKAAQNANLHTVLVTRDGIVPTATADSKEIVTANTFADISSNKRKSPDDVEAQEQPPSKQAKTDKPDTTTATSEPKENVDTEKSIEEEAKTTPTEKEEQMEVDSTTETKTEITKTAEEIITNKKVSDVAEADKVDKPEDRADNERKIELSEVVVSTNDKVVEEKPKEDLKESVPETKKTETKADGTSAGKNECANGESKGDEEKQAFNVNTSEKSIDIEKIATIEKVETKTDVTPPATEKEVTNVENDKSEIATEKVEEKENKSELANGNSTENGASESHRSETDPVKESVVDQKQDPVEEDIKVKKVDDTEVTSPVTAEA